MCVSFRTIRHPVYLLGDGKFESGSEFAPHLFLLDRKIYSPVSFGQRHFLVLFHKLDYLNSFDKLIQNDVKLYCEFNYNSPGRPQVPNGSNVPIWPILVYWQSRAIFVSYQNVRISNTILNLCFYYILMSYNWTIFRNHFCKTIASTYQYMCIKFKLLEMNLINFIS